MTKNVYPQTFIHNGGVLQEIDPASSKALSSFKAWAEEEFGTVRSAFNVLDADGSGKMTWQEWSKKKFRRSRT